MYITIPTTISRLNELKLYINNFEYVIWFGSMVKKIKKNRLNTNLLEQGI